MTAGTHWGAAAATFPLPLWVFDAAHRLVAAVGTSAELDPGTPLTEVLRSLAFRGVLGAGDPADLVGRHLARRAEQQARYRAALLDGVLEALPHGVVVTGPDASPAW